MPWLPVVVCCSTLVLACGGLVLNEGESASRGDDAGTKTTLSVPASELPPDSPYGVWELDTLEGMSGGNGSTQTFGHLTLELRANGEAIARRCTRPYYEAASAAFRCAASSTYDCHHGKVIETSNGWRLDIPGLRSPAMATGGEILPAENDTIVVRDILPKYASGHFLRASDDSATRTCTGP